MRVLMINTEASVGGAAQAMWRLHKGFIQQGHESYIVARSNRASLPNAYEMSNLEPGTFSTVYSWIDKAKLILASKFGLQFSKYYSAGNIVKSPLFTQADVVNLHNLHGYYFDYRLLPKITNEKPTIWTLHDMWGLTGHCAYSYDCQRWQSGCHHCPLLKEPGRRLVEPRATLFDRTRSVWQSKRKIYQNSHFHVVAPSRWLSQQANNSILADTATIHYIPYGIDLSVFRPRSKENSRWALEIPQEAKVILFLADSLTNQRKGYQYLREALSQLTLVEPIILVTVGSGTVDSEDLENISVRNLGRISDQGLLSLVYSLADILIFPSLADNLPLVIMEALACGTPVVAFNVGGVPEMVHHLETGYLASYRDSEDLLRGIELLLREDSLLQRMAQNCRQLANRHYSNQLQVKKYILLFREVIKEFRFG